MSRTKGKAYVHGELWNAETDEPIAAGEGVILTGCFVLVTALRGMTVKIRKQRGEVW